MSTFLGTISHFLDTTHFPFVYKDNFSKLKSTLEFSISTLISQLHLVFAFHCVNEKALNKIINVHVAKYSEYFATLILLDHHGSTQFRSSFLLSESLFSLGYTPLDLVCFGGSFAGSFSSTYSLNTGIPQDLVLGSFTTSYPLLWSPHSKTDYASNISDSYSFRCLLYISK